jgi:hypothetical protein
VPYLSNLAEEEIVSVECVLSIILKKSVNELKELDFEIELPIKLRNLQSKLPNCSPGFWKFTGLPILSYIYFEFEI